MQKRISRVLGVFFTVGILMTVLLLTASAKTVVSGDFKFDVGSKSATLVEYTGKGKTVKIPSKISGVTVTKIADEAFWQKSTVTSVTIPSGVTSIGKAAFNECTGLTKVVLPSKLKTLGESAFWYCKNLKSVVIPESVTKIGKNAFKGCSSSLTAYVISGSYAETYIKSQGSITLGYRYASSLKLSATTLKLAMGDTSTLKVTLSPSVLYNKKVTYASSDTKVAKVSSSGKVTPVACGTAKITVTAQDGSGKKATCTVTVVPSGVGTIKQTKTEKTSVTIKWTKSDGASKHTVYRYDSGDKKWVKLTDTTATEYTVKNLPLASTTRFRVRGYKKVDGVTQYGAYSYIYASTLIPAKVSGLTAETKSDTEIKLTWKKATNAGGYSVYSYNSSTKKYTLVGKTTSLNYTVTSLKADTQYSYAVKSYIASGTSTAESTSYSSVVTAKTYLPTVKGLAADEVLFSKVALSWTAVSGAEGYEIVMEWAEGSDTLTVGEASAQITGLSPATAYTFKVRAIKENGENYGKYSAEVTAETMSIPPDVPTAVTAFNEAVATTKAYSGRMTAFELTRQKITQAENAAPEVTAYLTVYDSNTYYFDEGKTSDGKTISAVLSAAEVILTRESLEEGSVKCDENGSGYDITFTLKADETGDIVSGYTFLPDWQGATDADEGFELKKCTYTDVTVTVKIQDGRISYIETVTPFEADFASGENDGSFKGESTRRLALVYWE